MIFADSVFDRSRSVKEVIATSAEATVSPSFVLHMDYARLPDNYAKEKIRTE